MTLARLSRLRELIHFSRPITDVVGELAAFGWDSDKQIVTLERVHLSAILKRFLSGEISATDVEDWANAIECREDIGLSEDAPVAEVLFELANPLVTRALTSHSATKWVAVLDRGAA